MRADLPGLSDDEVRVALQDNVLAISGERKAQHETDHEGYYRLERAFGGFSRSLTLPDGIDPDAVQGRVDRGVLELRIPRPEQKKPRQVQIKLGDSTGDDVETIEAPRPRAPRRRTAATPCPHWLSHNSHSQ
ncbi:MAG: Hsp20/alpha crystallin family protein [Solirubrobacteraceae bacterium]